MLRLYFNNIFEGRGFVGGVIASFILFGVPVDVAIYVFNSGLTIKEGSLSLIISAFSIFSAMLFASQIAAFNVFNYKATVVSKNYSVKLSEIIKKDDIQEKVEESLYGADLLRLRGAFKRINGGIAVLTILAVMVVVIAMMLAINTFPKISPYVTSIMFLFVNHFVFMFIYMCYQVFSFFDYSYSE